MQSLNMIWRAQGWAEPFQFMSFASFCLMCGVLGAGISLAPDATLMEIAEKEFFHEIDDFEVVQAVC